MVFDLRSAVFTGLRGEPGRHCTRRAGRARAGPVRRRRAAWLTGAQRGPKEAGGRTYQQTAEGKDGGLT